MIIAKNPEQASTHQASVSRPVYLELLQVCCSLLRLQVACKQHHAHSLPSQLRASELDVRPELREDDGLREGFLVIGLCFLQASCELMQCVSHPLVRPHDMTRSVFAPLSA